MSKVQGTKVNDGETGDQDQATKETKTCDAKSNKRTLDEANVECASTTAQSVSTEVTVASNTIVNSTSEDKSVNDTKPMKRPRTGGKNETASVSTSVPATTKSIFGSSTETGFASFGAGSSKPIFGAAASSASTSKTSIFGSSSTTSTSIFGKVAFAPSSSGFGTSATSAFGAATSTSAGLFGSSSANKSSIFTLGKSKHDDKITNDGGDATTCSPTKAATSASTPVPPLPLSQEPVKNGEENEETIITLRAKLFKLTRKAAVDESKLESQPGSEEGAMKAVGIQMATKVGQDAKGVKDHSEDKTNGSGNANANANANDASGGRKGTKMDWKEVGIGPLRVLTDDKHTRIVQRRENTPGGQGTKLILNIPLKDECSVEKKGDKFVRFAAFEVINDSVDDRGLNIIDKDRKVDEKNVEEEGEEVKFVPVQYLFKVKTVAEADSLLLTLEKFCGKKT